MLLKENLYERILWLILIFINPNSELFTNKIQYIPKAKYSKNAVELLRLRKYGLLTIGSDT